MRLLLSILLGPPVALAHARLWRILSATDTLISSAAHRRPDDEELRRARDQLAAAVVALERQPEGCPRALWSPHGLAYDAAYAAAMGEFRAELAELGRLIANELARPRDTRDVAPIKLRREGVRKLINDAHARLKDMRRNEIVP